MKNEEWPGTGLSSQVSEQLKRRAGNERLGGRIIMHIPDGFIDGKTAAITALLWAAAVGLALWLARRRLSPGHGSAG
jgi:hypothetical protein